MNETQLATTCSLLKLGNRYIKFTIPFSILFAGFEKFPSQKVKNKNSLFNLCNLLFNLHFPVQVPGPNPDLSPPFQILLSRFSKATIWGGGGEGVENVSALGLPSQLFSIRIHLSPVFWNIRYLYFITHHGLSHLSVS